ncbi:hypothetical protein CEXT_441521 [Caerostris extrusa]|uniref:Uncharacterized protein n=1 Tax=Caerostris extrusa TaxID=172846 RepID=A0AAV4XNA0_CAEEX|nr:hypothetical protein CEXT_441521 [Caerostris extrusa]
MLLLELRHLIQWRRACSGYFYCSQRNRKNGDYAVTGETGPKGPHRTAGPQLGQDHDRDPFRGRPLPPKPPRGMALVPCQSSGVVLLLIGHLNELIENR